MPGFWKGEGIPAGPRTRDIFECGSCGSWHRADFTGDCREDSERFAGPEDFEERTGEEAIEVDTCAECGAPYTDGDEDEDYCRDCR